MTDGAGDQRSEDTAPTDWREAIMDPKWKTAMLEEMEALEKNNTWEVVELPKGIEDLKQHLKREFEVKDLGQLRYFLGIEVSRSSKGLASCGRHVVQACSPGLMSDTPGDSCLSTAPSCSSKH